MQNSYTRPSGASAGALQQAWGLPAGTTTTRYTSSLPTTSYQSSNTSTRSLNAQLEKSIQETFEAWEVYREVCQASTSSDSARSARVWQSAKQKAIEQVQIYTEKVEDVLSQYPLSFVSERVKEVKAQVEQSKAKIERINRSNEYAYLENASTNYASPYSGGVTPGYFSPYSEGAPSGYASPYSEGAPSGYASPYSEGAASSYSSIYQSGGPSGVNQLRAAAERASNQAEDTLRSAEDAEAQAFRSQASVRSLEALNNSNDQNMRYQMSIRSGYPTAEYDQAARELRQSQTELKEARLEASEAQKRAQSARALADSAAAEARLARQKYERVAPPAAPQERVESSSFTTRLPKKVGSVTYGSRSSSTAYANEYRAPPQQPQVVYYPTQHSDGKSYSGIAK